MKIKALLFTFSLSALLLATQSCQKCKETGTVDICTTATGATAQYFSVTYIAHDTVSDTNFNYITSIYNLGNVRVYRSTSREGPWQIVQENFSDGKFGPYDFTCPAQETQLATVYDQWYKFEKDTFKTDTFRVRYAAQTDECHSYWALLDYYKDGVLLEQYQGMEKADIEIRDTL